MYKVLGEDMLSPYYKFKYKLKKKYVCENFDTDSTNINGIGFYATDIDGLIYVFRTGKRVFECEVGGKRVEINKSQRRYETIELIREVSYDELKKLAQREEEKLGYRMSDILFPINPFDIDRENVTQKDIELLKEWDQVHWLMNYPSGGWPPIIYSIWETLTGSPWSDVIDMFMSVVEIDNLASEAAAFWAYISSFFPNIKKWEFIKHKEYVNPFKPGSDLWRSGLVPTFDWKTWKLYGGKNKNLLWEGSF
jgi:hypothetical protein